MDACIDLLSSAFRTTVRCDENKQPSICQVAWTVERSTRSDITDALWSGTWCPRCIQTDYQTEWQHTLSGNLLSVTSHSYVSSVRERSLSALEERWDQSTEIISRRLDCRRMAVDGYLILLKHAKWLIRPPAAQASQMTMFSLAEVSSCANSVPRMTQFSFEAWCYADEYHQFNAAINRRTMYWTVDAIKT